MPPRKAAGVATAAAAAVPAAKKTQRAADKKATAKEPDETAAAASKVKKTKTATTTTTDAKPTTNGVVAPKKTAAAPAAATKKRKAVEEPEDDDEPIDAPAPKKKTKTAAPLNETSTNGTAKAAPKTKTAAKSAKAAPKTAKKAKTPVPEEDVPEPAAATVASPAVAEEEEQEAKPKTKKAAAASKVTKKAAAPKKTAAAAAKIGRKINSAPTQKLDVYVFGEGSSGELGLGSKKVDGKKPIDVKRPRLNANLSASKVGVVQVACGGMHVAALTHDNKIYTWGVNDQGALGRDTTWDGGLRDADKEDSDSEDDDDGDTGINPLESTPAAVSNEHFPEGTKFVQVVASDSATFALTEDGRVYGWGTFRSSDGILGFSHDAKVQSTPTLVPELKNIKSLAAGSNHILALDQEGVVVAWGAGQQNQLGRRIIERNKMSSLTPMGVGFPKRRVQRIACGSYHSFALDKDGKVWAWGLNNFGETGVQMGAGDDEAAVLRPTIIESLRDYKIKDIAGGEHHSLACAEDGELLAWGRVDGHQVGIPLDKLKEEDTIFDERNNPRILSVPTVLPNISNVSTVAAGTDNNFAVTTDGKVYSWGFSANYQTGQGSTDDVEVPTQIDNTAIRGKMIVGAGAGGQYSVLIGVSDEPLTNGVNHE